MKAWAREETGRYVFMVDGRRHGEVVCMGRYGRDIQWQACVMGTGWQGHSRLVDAKHDVETRVPLTEDKAGGK